MLSSQIEARLRFAAPDEPAVLPPLVLPEGVHRADVPMRVALRARIGSRRADMRLLFVALMVALAVVAAIVGGTPHRPPADPFVYHGDAFSVAWPGDWDQPIDGSFWLGDGSEPFLLAATVVTIATSRELSGCADVTPGPTLPGPVMTGQPAPSDVIDPQPDAMMMCVRSAELPDDTVRITLLTGERADVYTTPGLTDDWTETVDGAPAQLVVDGVDETRWPGVDEIRTWTLVLPSFVGSIVRLRAELSGPDLEGGRAAVDDILASFTIENHPPALNLSTIGDVRAKALDAIAEQARALNGSEFFACFPRRNDGVEVMLEDGPLGHLDTPVKASCSTFITPAASALWKLVLEVSFIEGDNARVVWSRAYFLDAEGNVVAEGQIEGADFPEG
ncbi:MAG TPA: hypothetical protein VFC71_03550 [Candidatus Polarisedimenticolia bacterium]|nr:hypothetical protein [Candidatus Polarisedimenticolia bacterium]